jgi:hypothetical protein
VTLSWELSGTHPPHLPAWQVDVYRVEAAMGAIAGPTTSPGRASSRCFAGTWGSNPNTPVSTPRAHRATAPSRLPFLCLRLFVSIVGNFHELFEIFKISAMRPSQPLFGGCFEQDYFAFNAATIMRKFYIKSIVFGLLPL